MELNKSNVSKAFRLEWCPEEDLNYPQAWALIYKRFCPAKSASLVPRRSTKLSTSPPSSVLRSSSPHQGGVRVPFATQTGPVFGYIARPAGLCAGLDGT